MQRYVEQLISDIRKATWIINPPAEEWEGVDLNNEAEVEDIAYIEKTVFGKKKSISEITGIEKKLLPPPKKLNKEQQKVLAVELEHLLHHFNLYPNFPKNLPDHLKYGVIWGIWNKKYVPVSFGENHIELCNFELENCPFPGYCNTCKEVQTEIKQGKKSNFDKNYVPLLPAKEEIDNFMQFQKKEKIKAAIKNKKPNENHIPGIYSYCDRWCERCSFTSRCTNFSLGEEFGFSDEDLDISNKTFWENLSLIFQVTLELFIEKANKLGIDLNVEIDENCDLDKNENHPLLLLSEEYSINVFHWLQNNSVFFKNKAVILATIDEKRVITLIDAIEIIQWYHIFISAKLDRALFQVDDDDVNDPIMISDCNGSAKAALIAIDRSIAAFGYILENISELEDDCLKYLSQLSKIKIITEQFFPQARNFIRPGFDE